MGRNNIIFNFKSIWVLVLLSLFYTLPSFSQNNILGTSFEGGRGLIYMQSARTYGSAHYSLGLQGLTMQREYFVQEASEFKVPKDNTTIIGIPATIGITDFIDLSASFYFYHDARPYKNKFDIYDYYNSSESGIGSTRLGLKIRLPLNQENRFQIATKLGATFNNSKSQIDGLNYRWSRIDNDFEISLLETINLTSNATLHFEQGYVVSGSEIFDDQLVIAAGLNVHPLTKYSFGLELHNRTFMGVSPQTVVTSIYDHLKYWEGYAHLGDPNFIKDDDIDFFEDFFVVVPSISYKVNDSFNIRAGIAINIADQKGPEEPFQFAIGITYNNALKFIVDSDKDGIKDSRDKELFTPKGYPVDSYGVSRDSDGDGVPDGHDNQPNTPKGAIVSELGVAIDSDGDGVYDGIDIEPDTPKGCEVDAYGIALDDDNDGVPNSFDKELNTPNRFEVDEKGVALDDDGDGVPNSIDKETNTPKGHPINENGVAITPLEKQAQIQSHYYSIHVSSFRSENLANSEVALFRLRGNEASKVFTNVPEKGNWYRVYVGRYATEAEAKQAAQVLRDRGYASDTNVMKLER